MAGDNACPVCGGPIVPTDSGIPHSCARYFGSTLVDPRDAELARLRGEVERLTREIARERDAYEAIATAKSLSQQAYLEAASDRDALRDRLAAVERERDAAQNRFEAYAKLKDEVIQDNDNLHDQVATLTRAKAEAAAFAACIGTIRGLWVAEDETINAEHVDRYTREIGDVIRRDREALATSRAEAQRLRDELEECKATR